ncbi:glycosyltransferase family 4 protein [Myroides sp. C8-3]|uniref:glycosyltransferase family 4 protein n=1 Tax=Myroides sp. C8-3 TaxID=3400533 RepID=UPI003D2F7448
MKILLWAPLGAGTHYWGPGTNIFRLYKCLKNENIKITLVHGSSMQSQYPELFDEQIKLSNYDSNSVVQKILFFTKGKKWLEENYHKYDVFHGISAYQTTFYFAKMFHDLGKPAFVKITGEYGGFGDSGYLSKILGISRWRKRNLNSITGYISISSTITDNLKNNGVALDKIVEIPNGVDIDRFSKLTTNTKEELYAKFDLSKKLTVSYIGGLTENKRVYELVVAIGELVKEGLDMQLLLVGPDRSGADKIKEKIFEYIDSENISDFVKYFPHTSEPEVFYNLSDIYVLNSRSEGMPNSLLEAMSCELACIVTPVSGSKDLITDGFNGLYVDGSVEDLKEKLRKIIFDSDMRCLFGKQARSTILSAYSSNIVLDKHLEVFEESLK